MGKIETPKPLKFIKGGRLNMLVIRHGKEVEKVDADSAQFLANEATVRSSGMDVITFQQNVVFKVTLDFGEARSSVAETAVRETTDWILMSCMGNMAVFNRTEERLVLQQCVAAIGTTVPELEKPIGIVLRFNDDEWLVDKITAM
jgi:hypothetical protein